MDATLAVGSYESELCRSERAWRLAGGAEQLSTDGGLDDADAVRPIPLRVLLSSKCPGYCRGILVLTPDGLQSTEAAGVHAESRQKPRTQR